jgi:hypothetical protein
MKLTLQKLVDGNWISSGGLKNYKIKNGSIFIADEIEVGVKDNFRVVDEDDIPQALQVKFTKDEVI